MAMQQDGGDAFVTFGRGLLKVFNAAKNFGFISPVFKGEDSEGPPLPACTDEGLWFFGNHSLPHRANPGIELTFEIWENAQGKAQARRVQVAAEPTPVQPEMERREMARPERPRLHPNEPRVIYPSVYVSDVPVEWSEGEIRKLHRQLGLNPDTIMGLKFLPFTEVSLGLAGDKGSKQATPVTGAVILRYLNEEAANAGVERLKGHPIQTSTGVTKHLGAKHATPPKWVVQRKQQEEEERRQSSSKGEAIMQRVKGVVVRVSMAGYGVIKSPDWGEVMWRQYELPTNLRTLQFADKAKFQREVEGREEFRRLKEMEGKEVEAELYKLPDGQLRASHVRVMAGMLTDRPGAGAAPPPPAPPGFGGSYPSGNEPGAGSSGSPDDRNLPWPGGDQGSGPPSGGPPGMPPMMGMPPGMPPMPPGGPGGPPGPPPGMPPGPPPGMPPGPPGMPPWMPPGMDPQQYQAMMQAMQAQMMGGKKEKKKDKKDKEKKDKKDKKKKRDRSDDEDEDDELRDGAPKKRRIDDDDF